MIFKNVEQLFYHSRLLHFLLWQSRSATLMRQYRTIVLYQCLKNKIFIHKVAQKNNILVFFSSFIYSCCLYVCFLALQVSCNCSFNYNAKNYILTSFFVKRIWAQKIASNNAKPVIDLAIKYQGTLNCQSLKVFENSYQCVELISSLMLPKETLFVCNKMEELWSLQPITQQFLFPRTCEKKLNICKTNELNQSFNNGVISACLV